MGAIGNWQIGGLEDWEIGELVSDGKQLPMLRREKNAGQPPVFQRVGIVGLGLIGGSIALAAREIWPGGLVIGVDRKDVLERAMVRHAIDVAADDAVVLAEADLVILAAPIQQNLEILRELPDNVTGSAVVTDTGSTKRAIVERAASLPDRFAFIGGHPLGGAARGGIEHARADMFNGRPWLFTPAHGHDANALEKLKSFVSGLGAVPQILSPQEHDRLLAFISHLPQLTVSALMHVVGETAREEGLSLSGRGLQDTTRLASSPADIWKEVCATNADEIGSSLDALISVLRQLRADLQMGKSIDEVFESANLWREALLSGKP
jgi:prephenate dehydrogenase